MLWAFDLAKGKSMKEAFFGQTVCLSDNKTKVNRPMKRKERNRVSYFYLALECVCEREKERESDVTDEHSIACGDCVAGVTVQAFTG